MITQEMVMDVLRTIKYPNLSRDIVSFGLIKAVEIENSAVKVSILVNSRDPNVPVVVEREIIRELRKHPAVRDVEVAITWKQPENTPQPRDPHARPDDGQPLLPLVRKKIAVASGKGGVGKSTVAAGLARYLQRRGWKTGLVDFDIYGPSVPTLTGTHERARAFNNRILPLESDGLKLMSMGFLVEPETPMIWRGPMVHQATEQFLRDVEWGELDVLVVDLPPGTGDAQMTLSQKIKLDGAVIVSTPQDLALIDARKGVGMFEKMQVPILGIVENMSGFRCGHCGEVTYIFGYGGAERQAEKLNVPLLARLPLTPSLVEASDAGNPGAAIAEDAILREQFEKMAESVEAKINLHEQVISKT